MARYAHDVLSSPVKYFETVEKIRSLGINNPEGQVIRAIEASRQLEKNGIENDYCRNSLNNFKCGVCLAKVT